MRKLNLKNKKIDYDKLAEYGFILNDNSYIYEKNILNNEFKVIIEIGKEKISKVIDLSSNLEYILVDVNASGNFISNVKEEYEKILNDFINKCTINDVFKNKQTKEIIKYINDKYEDNLEYLWEKFPNFAVIRNKKNNKWYCLIAIVSASKLGLKENDNIEIINVMYQKDKIDSIIDNKMIFEGYHMNKKSWITIKLGNNINIEKIKQLIDNSYDISINK